jgi:carbon-monoxide dehydrogenase iron sulfur subunit
MKKVYAKEEFCLACRLCEISCLVKHSRSKRLIRAYRTERDSVAPAIHVEEKGRVSFALQCRHCQDAPCIEACIAAAMYRDPKTGAVLCDEKRCVGCWSCVMVCPAGAVAPGKHRKVASKCDLCMGEETPVCVVNCPNEALVYEERED